MGEATQALPQPTPEQLAEIGRQAMKEMGIDRFTVEATMQRVRAERLAKEAALGLTGPIKQMESIYDQRWRRWEIERRFVAAMYVMGASLRQIASSMGCSPQSIQNRLAKELPEEIRLGLAKYRQHTGAPLMGYDRFVFLKDVFFSRPEAITQGTLGDTINRLSQLEMETDEGESVSRICGRADDGTGVDARERSSGESTGAAQAEGSTEDRSGEG